MHGVIDRAADGAAFNDPQHRSVWSSSYFVQGVGISQ
jgi:hypothetical protein